MASQPALATNRPDRMVNANWRNLSHLLYERNDAAVAKLR